MAPSYAKKLVPVAALLAGLGLGLSVSYVQIKKEQTLCQVKIKEANSKTAFFQKKLIEEKSEAMAALQLQCQADMKTLRDTLQHEQSSAGAELGRLKEYARKLELKAVKSEKASAAIRQELARKNQELDRELKQTREEKRALQAGLNMRSRELSSCESNNAELCVLSEELIKKYHDKGVGAALLEKEPLTRVKKVALEQLTQSYQEQIDQRKMQKMGEKQ